MADNLIAACDEILRLQTLIRKLPWRYDHQHPEITSPFDEHYFLITSECRLAPDLPIFDEFGHADDPNYAYIVACANAAPRLARIARAALEVIQAEKALDDLGCDSDPHLRDDAMQTRADAISRLVETKEAPDA